MSTPSVEDRKLLKEHLAELRESEASLAQRLHALTDQLEELCNLVELTRERWRVIVAEAETVEALLAGPGRAN